MHPSPPAPSAAQCPSRIYNAPTLAMTDESPFRTPAVQAERLPWEPPTVSQLPRLTELTLATGGGIPGNGGTGGSGSTVIP